MWGKHQLLTLDNGSNKRVQDFKIEGLLKHN